MSNRPNCVKEALASGAFCTSCGANINAVPPPPPPPPPPPQAAPYPPIVTEVPISYVV
ncbi:MAG: hypothetical protein QXV21_04770 [Candidatus Bathyarchaeia archaeon]